MALPSPIIHIFHPYLDIGVSQRSTDVRAVNTVLGQAKLAPVLSFHPFRVVEVENGLPGIKKKN
jgi:hypothetical protein